MDKTKLKEINKKSLSEIPDTVFNFFRIKTINAWVYKLPYEFITEEINDLTICINKIIKNCMPSNDKYEINSGVNQKNIALQKLLL
ncbi:hypothetical protein AYY16_06585 [Morganella psychrotolerans]|uniref:hypothetical protein n=1 Tax=Morganella psychrotolerans TaxID=368603 RepID=UPI0007FCC463|nr:hypothetical protein [Morganella psychrotolerans]OBU08882.1 hypothetical protein AYY16_06585 [Morganella psychrotolerans]